MGKVGGGTQGACMPACLGWRTHAHATVCPWACLRHTKQAFRTPTAQPVPGFANCFPAPTHCSKAHAGAAAAAGEAAGPSGEAGSAHALPPQPPSLPGLLPASVAEQIRKAQIRAALAGQAPASWLVGAKVQAVYSADGQYYDATVEGVAASGNVVVAYEGYAEKEEVRWSGGWGAGIPLLEGKVAVVRGTPLGCGGEGGEVMGWGQTPRCPSTACRRSR